MPCSSKRRWRPFCRIGLPTAKSWSCSRGRTTIPTSWVARSGSWRHRPTATTVDLINLGVELATGTVVHILTCDVEVTDGWTDAIWSHFADPTVGAVSPVVVRADGGRVVSRGVRYELGGRRSVRVKSSVAKAECPRSRWPDTGSRFLPSPGAGWMLPASVARWATNWPTRTWPSSCERADGGTVHEADSVIRFSGEVGASEALVPCAVAMPSGLFWRNVCMNSPFTAYAAHAGVVLGEILGNLLRPALALHLLGRACAVLESSHYRQRRDQLSAVRGTACDADPETVPFMRRPNEAGASERVRPRSAA